jgi:dsRNA-specific ribonuclease
VDIATYKNAKSRLQEWSQNTFRATPRYRTVEANGPDHDKQFTVHVVIDGLVWGIGYGKSKQVASQEAAANALDYVEARQYDDVILPPYPESSQTSDSVVAEENGYDPVSV